MTLSILLTTVSKNQKNHCNAKERDKYKKLFISPQKKNKKTSYSNCLIKCNLVNCVRKNVNTNTYILYANAIHIY